MRRELETILGLARTVASDELPALAGDLEHIRFVILARLAAPPEAREDRMLDIDEAAARLGRSRDWLYRAKKLPFRRQDAVGGKVLFSSSGLDAYLKKSK